jgi:hypothetical protein
VKRLAGRLQARHERRKPAAGECDLCGGLGESARSPWESRAPAPPVGFPPCRVRGRCSG